MPITKEALEKRLAEAKAAREQALAQANVIGGVIQDVQHWLNEFDKVEPEQPTDPETPEAPKGGKKGKSKEASDGH